MKKSLSTFAIAGTYIGTVVGAGFASGQEVLQFFGFFGAWGIAGIALTTVLFVAYGVAIMDIGHSLGAKSHLPVIREIGGKTIGPLIDLIVTFFLFGVVVTMAAGSGAIFVEQFGLAAIWGNLLMVAVSAFTVILGISRVIESISLIAPILVTSVFGLGLLTVLGGWRQLIGNFFLSNPGGAAVPFWPLAAVLYVSYNLVLSIAVLAPLGALSSPARIRSGGLWGGLGLGMGILAISLAIMARAPQVAGLQIPMLGIAGAISPWLRSGYSVVLLLEIYTTAVATLYGFVSRIADPDSRAYKWLAVGAGGLAFLLARFGFSNLVATLYPAVGFAGLLFLGAITFRYLPVAVRFWPNQTGPLLKPQTDHSQIKDSSKKDD